MGRRIVFIKLLLVVLMLSVTGLAKADTLGVDVSRWQGVIDWDAAHPYTGFAIIKAGGSDEGLYVDSQFERNRDETRRLGIPRGYYYYTGGGDPRQEAEHFASIVGQLHPGELVAMDFEIDHPDPVGYSLLFLTRTEQLLGVKPLFYTNMNRVWAYDWQPLVKNGNQLWGAIYDEDPNNMPAPGSWPAVAVKQFTSGGTLAGVNTGSVDLNIFKSNPGDFQSLGRRKPPEITVNFGIHDITEALFAEPRPGPVAENASPDSPADEAAAPDQGPAADEPAGEGSAEQDTENGQVDSGEEIAKEENAEASENGGVSDSAKEMPPAEAGDGKQQKPGTSADRQPEEVPAGNLDTPVSSFVNGVFFPLSQIMQVTNRAEPVSCELKDSEGKWLKTCH